MFLITSRVVLCSCACGSYQCVGREHQHGRPNRLGQANTSMSTARPRVFRRGGQCGTATRDDRICGHSRAGR